MWFVTVTITLMIFQSCAGETVATLILARGGSKGLRLKNLQRVGGVSLVGNAIRTVRNAGLFDVTVSTDHPLIALEALKENASVFHRSRVTASDWAPSIWGAAEFLVHRTDVDTLILLQPTAPFVKPSHLKNAVIKLNEPVAFDCIFSVTRSFKLRWKLHNGLLYPLNFDTKNRPRRQDWSGELLESGSFYISRKLLISSGYFQNNK